jgi:H+/gluconate symporter-like permease
MNESLKPVKAMDGDEGAIKQQPAKTTGTSLSGWVATLLGLYLIGSGIFNIAKIIQEGGNTTQQSTELLRQSGIEPNAAPIAIIISYIVGAPIFLGSALLAIGSIARSAKRNAF